MAIPNPNPNIADGIKSDNKTYSSNKIESLIKTATELPIPEVGDAGKVLTVNSDADGYVLTVPLTEETTGEVTAGTDVVLTYSSLKQVGNIATLALTIANTTTATLARWGNSIVATVNIAPKYEITGITKIMLDSTTWYDVAYTIDTSGNVKISDIYDGVTTGTITGMYLNSIYVV